MKIVVFVGILKIKKIGNVRISAKIAGWGGDREDDEEDGGGE